MFDAIRSARHGSIVETFIVFEVSAPMIPGHEAVPPPVSLDVTAPR